MAFSDLVTAAQKDFPDLKINYKDQSSFMKILGKLLFFNKNFMTSYTTTVGSTVYFPTESFVKSRPISASVVLLHELVHIKDSYKYSKLGFSFLYLFPQILVLLCLPLFLVSWKIALLLLILCACPVPAFFRMFFEKRAYIVSLYVLHSLGKKLNFDAKLESHSEYFIKQFKNSAYYWMWIFNDINKELAQATVTIQADKKPFEDPIFPILDNLINDGIK